MNVNRIDSWDNLLRNISHYYNETLHKNIDLVAVYDVHSFQIKVYLSERKKCQNDPSYRASLIVTFDPDEINYREEGVIADLVDKINEILKPKQKVETKKNFNLNTTAHFCPCCGAPRKRDELKCPYCDIEFF